MRTKFTRIEIDPADLTIKEEERVRCFPLRDVPQGTPWDRRLERMRPQRGLPLRVSAFGILFRGHAGTDDPAEAARLADELGKALKERLAATGMPGLVSAIGSLGSGQGTTVTPDADLRMALNVARMVAMAAPRALAERAIASGGVRWRLRADLSSLHTPSVRRRLHAGNIRRREA